MSSDTCDPYYDYTRPTASSYDEDLLMTRECISNRFRTTLYIVGFAVAAVPVLLSLVVIAYGFATKGSKYARRPMFLVVWTTGMEMVAYCCYLLSILFAPTAQYLGKICWLFVFHFGFISVFHIIISWLNIPGPLSGPFAPKLDALRRRIYVKEVVAIGFETVFTVVSCVLQSRGDMKASNATYAIVLLSVAVSLFVSRIWMMHSARELIQAIETSITSIPTDATLNLNYNTASTPPPHTTPTSLTTSLGDNAQLTEQQNFMAKYAKDLRFTALYLGNLIMLSASVFFLAICIWIFATLPTTKGPR
ncbi:hypothetical protein HK104_006903, partial [Borealophlyctis nickersoniae]